MAEKKRKGARGSRIVYLRLPLPLWERVQRAGKADDRTAAYILRQAVERGLDAMGA